MTVLAGCSFLDVKERAARRRGPASRGRRFGAGAWAFGGDFCCAASDAGVSGWRFEDSGWVWRRLADMRWKTGDKCVVELSPRGIEAHPIRRMAWYLLLA